jgi:Ca-activated chloride channel family protein
VNQGTWRGALVMLLLSGVVAACGGSGHHCSGVIRLRMDVSQDTVGLLQKAAEDYRGTASVDGKCVQVTVDSKNSGTAMEALARGWQEVADGPRPDIWSPASSVWVTLLRQRAAAGQKPVGAGDPAPIMTTPLTIAMPRPMAQALGWPNKSIGWRDLAALARDPRGWARYGHPEWGAFKLGKTNPHLSTSGLDATVGAYFAATGTTSDLTPQNITDPRNEAFIRDIERSVVHYGDITMTFLTALQRADDQKRALSYVSAVTVEEATVWAYNQGDPTGDPGLFGRHAKPRTPLVSIYPSEGTIYSDHPFVPLTWMTAEQKKAAADFEAYLHGKGQALFLKYGYRTAARKPGPQINAASGLTPAEPKTTLSLPSADVLSKLLDTWDTLRKPARVLLVVDRSGSMQAGVPGTGESKVALAQAAAIQALGEFSDQDNVGLWQFSADMGGGKDWRQLQPMAAMDQAHRTALKKSIDAIKVNGGTGLYNTTADAYATVKSGASAGEINAVVVLTDGKNERTGGMDLETLLGRLGDRGGEPVRVFTIAYGSDADQGVLRQIAQASDGAEYDSSDPNSIQEVLTEVISNF